MKRAKKSKTAPARVAAKSQPRKASKSTSAVKPDDPRFAKVVAAFAADPALVPIADEYRGRDRTGKRAFGSSGLKVNGKLFAMMSSKAEFVVKLPALRVAAMVESGEGTYFDPGHGRLMKQWLTVTSARASWAVLAKEAHRFVADGR
jgi:hypothetical protein